MICKTCKKESVFFDKNEIVNVLFFQIEDLRKYVRKLEILIEANAKIRERG